MAENPDETETWDVVFDARGHFEEPHTNLIVPLGTIDVRQYLRGISPHGLDVPTISIAGGIFSTMGPRHRFGAILFIEKEGFLPLFKAVNLAERFDVAIMSTKGMSVTASRLLVERPCSEHNVPLLVLHDFDKSGFSIVGTLRRDTRRYSFAREFEVIDLGLRLADVEAWELEAIRLGKTSQRIAEEVRIKVEILNSTTIARSPMDNETARWVSGLSETLAGKLAAVGLIPKRDTARLGEFIDQYIAARTDVKPNSRKNFKATKARLLEFFAPATNLRDISPGDADAWLVSLRTAYSGASIALFVKRARQFFRSALRQKLIPENPFAELKIPSDTNKAREFFVTRENAQKILSACPDSEWRLIFALSRFGGLRCPSEHLELQWGDVDWERGRLLVHAPKTEHLESGGDQWIPLFPELRRYLEEAFDMADEGAVYVITRCREANVNLRTQLLRIIKRAGLMPWPRLFHSLRATRQTELAAEFPLHVGCSWIGNSVRIANKHYLQVTDADFQRAAKSGALALQNAVQQPAARFRADSQNRTQSEESDGVVLIGANGCDEGQYPRQESNL